MAQGMHLVTNITPESFAALLRTKANLQGEEAQEQQA